MLKNCLDFLLKFSLIRLHSKYTHDMKEILLLLVLSNKCTMFLQTKQKFEVIGLVLLNKFLNSNIQYVPNSKMLSEKLCFLKSWISWNI